MAFRHAGAARFAYNQGLRLQQEAYTAHKLDSAVKVPYSGFDLINVFNKWKLTAAAGSDAAGRPGLPWRQEVSQQVFEESLVNLGRGIQRFFDARKKHNAEKCGFKDARKKRKAAKGAVKVGFPTFKKKREDKLAFRIRNKRQDVRVEGQAIVLPKLGAVQLRESTRKLRRLLRQRPDGAQQAKVLFATVSHKAGRWFVRINVEACDVHPAQRHVAPEWSDAIGVDLGLKHMAVCGKADGTLVERIDDAPKPIKHALAKLRIRNRSLARKKKPRKGGSHKNRIKARRRLARTHQKIANQRRHYLHHLTSRLVKTHAHLVIEDLNVAGMLRNHKLGRSIADVSWGQWRRQLEYKAVWRNGRVTVAPWNFPSTKRCHKCHRVYDMPLGKDTFVCGPCNLSIPRDDNAFANLAQYGTSDAKQVEDGKIIPGDWVGSGRAVRCGETMPVRNQARPAPMGVRSLTSEKDAVGTLIVNRL